MLTREATVAADPLAMEHAHIKIRFIIILILGGLWHQTRGKSLLVKTEDEPAGYKQLDIKHGEQGGDYAETPAVMIFLLHLKLELKGTTHPSIYPQHMSDSF